MEFTERFRSDVRDGSQQLAEPTRSSGVAVGPHSRLRPQCQPRGIQERDAPQGDTAKSLPHGLGVNTWAQSWGL